VVLADLLGEQHLRRGRSRRGRVEPAVLDETVELDRQTARLHVEVDDGHEGPVNDAVLRDGDQSHQSQCLAESGLAR
jgi:hypothetical protein